MMQAYAPRKFHNCGKILLFFTFKEKKNEERSVLQMQVQFQKLVKLAGIQGCHTIYRKKLFFENESRKFNSSGKFDYSGKYLSKNRTLG